MNMEYLLSSQAGVGFYAQMLYSLPAARERKDGISYDKDNYIINFVIFKLNMCNVVPNPLKNGAVSEKPKE